MENLPRKQALGNLLVTCGLLTIVDTDYLFGLANPRASDVLTLRLACTIVREPRKPSLFWGFRTNPNPTFDSGVVRHFPCRSKLARTPGTEDENVRYQSQEIF
jgi:hypothetical protein